MVVWGGKDWKTYVGRLHFRIGVATRCERLMVSQLPHFVVRTQFREKVWALTFDNEWLFNLALCQDGFSAKVFLPVLGWRASCFQRLMYRSFGRVPGLHTRSSLALPSRLSPLSLPSGNRQDALPDEAGGGTEERGGHPAEPAPPGRRQPGEDVRNAREDIRRDGKAQRYAEQDGDAGRSRVLIGNQPLHTAPFPPSPFSPFRYNFPTSGQKMVTMC